MFADDHHRGDFYVLPGAQLQVFPHPENFPVCYMSLQGCPEPAM
jgi:hypothetical protein